MSIYDFTVNAADGSPRALSDYAGKVLLIVNVASKCGFTPQYEGLEALYRKDADRGLEILGFPCNQFGGQEPGTQDEIAEFCSTTYNVTFPIFEKVEVNGPGAAPLYAWLRSQAKGDFSADNPLYKHLKDRVPNVLESDDVKWNFTKFLVGRDGNVIRRYESTATPEQIAQDIEPLLG